MNVHLILQVWVKGDVHLVQLRSGIVPNYAVAFCDELYAWIESYDQVILLTGLDQSRRDDRQLQASPLTYLSVNGCFEDKIASLGWHPLTSLPPGGGFARFLIPKFVKQPLLVLCWFTAEGGISF